jgi:hypothetical protein
VSGDGEVVVQGALSVVDNFSPEARPVVHCSTLRLDVRAVQSTKLCVVSRQSRGWALFHTGRLVGRTADGDAAVPRGGRWRRRSSVRRGHNPDDGSARPRSSAVEAISGHSEVGTVVWSYSLGGY